MKILFLCVANSARSQMANGLAIKYFSDKHRVESAGSMPSKVHPCAITVLEEMECSAAGLTSKSVQDVEAGSFDLIITLCADEVCPIVPTHVEKLHWPFTDPAVPGKSIEEQLPSFRQIRDQISQKLKEFQIERNL